MLTFVIHRSLLPHNMLQMHSFNRPSHAVHEKRRAQRGFVPTPSYCSRCVSVDARWPFWRPGRIGGDYGHVTRPSGGARTGSGPCRDRHPHLQVCGNFRRWAYPPKIVRGVVEYSRQEGYRARMQNTGNTNTWHRHPSVSEYGRRCTGTCIGVNSSSERSGVRDLTAF